MTEKDAIAKAVQHYIDGAKSGSSAKMRRAHALDSRLSSPARFAKNRRRANR